jgi:hypothetical protein
VDIVALQTALACALSQRSDPEWQIVKPLVPPARHGGASGRPMFARRSHHQARIYIGKALLNEGRHLGDHIRALPGCRAERSDFPGWASFALEFTTSRINHCDRLKIRDEVIGKVSAQVRVNGDRLYPSGSQRDTFRRQLRHRRRTYFRHNAGWRQ